jgi:hypothetical protein
MVLASGVVSHREELIQCIAGRTYAVANHERWLSNTAGLKPARPGAITAADV